jgi:hypothetical protein
VTAITLTDWGRRMDAGETTFVVGPVPGRCAVYLDRAEAEAAADELGGTYIEWIGHTGHLVTTPEYQAAIEAPDPELEMEAGL